MFRLWSAVVGALVGASVTIAGPISGSGSAHASPLLDLLGAAAGPHPFTAAALGTGPELAYANPALLPWATPGFDLGFVVLASDLRVDLAARPDGVDVPASIYDLRELLADGTTRRLEPRPLPTDALRAPRGDTRERDTLGYLSLGFVQPLVPERLTFALSAFIPTAGLQSQRPFYADEREQYFSNRLHFELYGDRLRTQSFAFALGGRPVDWLSLGAGVTLTTRSTAETDVYIGDSAYQETALVNSRVTVSAGLVPHFAVVAQPVDALRLGLTLHLPSANPVDGQSDVQFWTYPYPEGESSVTQRFAFSHGSLPLRAAFAAAWAPPASSRDALGYRLAATARWTRWSAYEDRHAESPAGFADALDLSASGELSWRDHRFALGLTWAPSPVPDQDGRTNYVDNDRLGASLGWSADVPLGDATLRIGLALQLHRLLPRSVLKDAAAADPVRDELPSAIDIRTGDPAPEADGLQTNNPGYPGFASSGWLFAGGLRFAVAY